MDNTGREQDPGMTELAAATDFKVIRSCIVIRFVIR